MHLLFALMVSLSPAAVAEEQAALQGTWRITALIDNGRSLSVREIATEFSADGQLIVEGNTASILPPGSFDRRKMVFVLGEGRDRKTIDLAGATKVNSRGIYQRTGDTMVLCLGTPDSKDRPADFAAGKGSQAVMISLSRVLPRDPKPAPPPEAKIEVAPVPEKHPEETLRKQLIGTWGHQDDDATYYYTLNADGTFSSRTDYKRRLRHLFTDNVRSSGTWKLEGQVVIVTLTTSTDSRLRGQIISSRITHIGPNDLVMINSEGRAKRQWRVR
jgi:uncharacterized protein (TIGR03067 family)